MSISEKPRPKPRSREPNRMRDPFLKRIACSPLTRRIESMVGLIDLRSAIADIDWNVSACVLARCAVQIVVVPGSAIDRAKTRAPRVYVLPVCRGIDMIAPPTPQA